MGWNLRKRKPPRVNQHRTTTTSSRGNKMNTMCSTTTTTITTNNTTSAAAAAASSASLSSITRTHSCCRRLGGWNPVSTPTPKSGGVLPSTPSSSLSSSSSVLLIPCNKLWTLSAFFSTSCCCCCDCSGRVPLTTRPRNNSSTILSTLAAVGMTSITNTTNTVAAARNRRYSWRMWLLLTTWAVWVLSSLLPWVVRAGVDSVELQRQRRLLLQLQQQQQLAQQQQQLATDETIYEPLVDLGHEYGNGVQDEIPVQHQQHLAHRVRLTDHDVLLGWNAYEGHLEAAAQFWGTIDVFFRGGAAASGESAGISSTTTTTTKSHHHQQQPLYRMSATALPTTATSKLETTTTSNVEEDTASSKSMDKDLSTTSAAAIVIEADGTTINQGRLRLFGNGIKISKRNSFQRQEQLDEEKTEQEKPEEQQTPSYELDRKNRFSSKGKRSSATTSTRRISNPSAMQFSLFQVGDGSESDPDGIPTRYMRMHKDQRPLAAKALQATLEWRQQHDIDHILTRPQTKYDICKAVFPHSFLGRDVENRVVFLQRPPLINLDKARVNGLTEDDLLFHYVYVNEYLWQILEGDKPLSTMTSIIDLSGLKLSVLRQTDVLSFVKVFVSTMDSHYPQRAHKTLVVNAPKWFHALYKLVSPLMRETTKSKIEIHVRGKKQDEALKRYLGDQIVALLPKSFHSSYNNKKKRKVSTGKQHSKRNKIITSNRQENNEDSAINGAADEDDVEGEDENDDDDVDDEGALHDDGAAVDEVPPMSEMETNLRSFTLARIKDAKNTMQVVA